MNFKLKNCNVYISYPLLALLTAGAFFNDANVLFYSLIAALCHEAGHLFTMRIFDCMPKSIRFTVFNASISDSTLCLKSRFKQLLISASGCAVNFLLFFSLLCFKKFLNTEVLDSLISANLFLGVFNILPVFNLDGGEIFLIVLSGFLTPKTAESLLKSISFVILTVLFTISIIMLINHMYNYSYLITSCYLICLVLLKG